MSAARRARARLMNCNVIDVIHWSAQRVRRMSPAEAAGVSAVTVHHPGVHAVTAAQRPPQPGDADVNGGVDTNGTRPARDRELIQLILLILLIGEGKESLHQDG